MLHEQYQSRLDFLAEAHRLTTQDRNTQYGSFDHNMEVQAELWNIYLREKGLLAPDKMLQGSDASYLMGLSKYMRIMCGKLHPDNTQDEINYCAEGGYLAIAEARFDVVMESLNEWDGKSSDLLEPKKTKITRPEISVVKPQEKTEKKHERKQ